MRKEWLGLSYLVGADRVRPEPRERGIGIVLVMLSVLVLTVLTAGIVVNARRDIYSSFNYRIDSQAAYVADAGLQAAANWFKNSYTPAAASSYNLNVSPVTLAGNGNPVQLDGIKKNHNYPVSGSATQTSFITNLQDQTVTAPSSPPLNGAFSVTAQLMSAQPITTVAGGPTLLERWLVTSQGKAAGAVAQTSAVITSFVKTLPKYAALACSSGPASLKFGDIVPPITTASANSYDSSLGPYGPSNMGSQGSVFTNGELHLDNAAIAGNASYGSLTGSGTITGTSSVISTPFDCSTLPLPSTLPGTTNLTITTATSPYNLSPGSYGNVLCTSACTLNLAAGTYNINSLQVDSGSYINVTGPGGTVINIVGTAPVNGSGNALWLDSGSVANSTAVPSNLTIFVNRTEPVKADSGTQAAYVLIAPKSAVTNDSNTTMFGMIIGKTIYSDSGASIHYDVALSRTALALSPPTAIAWNRAAN